MRINEILIESQLEQLDEGPKLDAFGRGVGKVVSGAAKGIGAVAGGVRGAFTALKKGYQSGKAVVGDEPDPNAGKPGYTDPVADPKAAPAPVADPNAGKPGYTDPVADPKAAPAPVADPNAAPAPVADPNAAPAPAPSTTTPPSAAEINAQGPEGSAPAKDQTGAAGAALAKTDAVTDKQTSTKAGETVYAQVKANIDKLDAKGKGRILQLVKQSLATPAQGTDPLDLNKDGKVDATEKSMARNKAKPGTAKPPAGGAADPGAAAFGQMANTLTQEPTTGAASTAAAPTSEPAATATPTPDTAAKGQTLTPQQQASQAALKAKLKGTKAAGKSVAASTTGGFGKAVAAAKEKGIATASKINHGNALSEALAQRVEMHKQKIFETGLSKGTISVFRK
jgi:2-oxoglutarate dehydrogenase E2 component (dihydrolipoamide succinyltransferase)